LGLAQAQNEKSAVDELITAIDVADLINRGSSDADIAELLSSQRGFDRASARNKGKTDEQIITYLITNTKIFENLTDKNKSIKHKTDGDKYSLEAQYKKAAKEYSLAIAYSKGDYTPHKLRGDAYRQYLTTEFSSSPGSSSDEAKNILLKKTRTLLCKSIYSDYRKSIEIIDEVIRKNIADINMIKFRMEQRIPNYETNDKASPSRSRTAQDIKNMRQFNTLSQVQRVANQAKNKMEKAVSDYKLVCEKEDAAWREFIKMERENKREKKWAKYIETEEMSYFYDKSNIAKSDDNLEVWTRRENMNDEMSYDAAKVRINCGKSTSATTDFMKYNEMGDIVSEIHNDNVIMTKVFPGAMEERLLKEVCK
jgi:hypothetical protein